MIEKQNLFCIDFCFHCYCFSIINTIRI
uniref:Uncharacterized protein n=1 Tax=Heterorhabditis bacteriophora TaxID=37862 RepID=A0A1I7W926_HETBA